MNEKIKVLMVDDEEQFRATTKKILNRRGLPRRKGWSTSWSP